MDRPPGRRLKSKLVMGALVIGGLIFLDGSMLLGYSPGTFTIAAALAMFAALFGSRWMRVAGICLCAGSVAMGVHHYQRKQHFEGMVKAVHERAETNSIAK